MMAGRLRAGWIDHETGLPGLETPERQCAMRRAAAGGYVSRGQFAGGKLMVWPRVRRVAVEGRLAALASGDSGAHGLRSPVLIEHAAARSTAELRWLGVLSDGEPCYVRRLDLATDVRWRDSAAGRGMLNALADAAPAERHKLNVWAGEHGPETVSLFEQLGRGHELVGRIYDRGVKTGAHPHGVLIRFERQLRWQGHASPRVQEALADRWGARGLGWVANIRVSNREAVALADQELLISLIERGTVAAQTGLRLLGSLVVSDHRDPTRWWKLRGASGAQTGRKHRRELAALGLPSPTPALVTPELSEVIAAALSAWEHRATDRRDAPRGRPEENNNAGPVGDGPEPTVLA
jgi:hypothetical protein